MVEKKQLTEEQRNHLKALSERIDIAYKEFDAALSAFGPIEWTGSCGLCTCLPFLGEETSASSRCERCGHESWVHVR